MKPLIDRFNRTIKKLRISVTDQCNLRCTYCMPEEGMEWLKKKDILTYEEIFRLAKIFVISCGIEHIRITGGEPLVRKDLKVLIKQLNTLKNFGLKSIGMTTNGILLKQHLPDLKESGLDSLNISLDTTNTDRFLTLNRRDRLKETLEGIQEAIKFFPNRCKLNAVIQPLNEEDILPLVELAKKSITELRFIEKMPLEAQNTWQNNQVITGQKIIETINEKYPLKPHQESRGASPADRWTLEENKQTIGFINSVTEPFCDRCDRIRLTADGALRNCLFATDETDLKTPLRDSTSDRKLENLIRHNIAQKWAGHKINHPDFKRASRSMSQVGG